MLTKEENLNNQIEDAGQARNEAAEKEQQAKPSHKKVYLKKAFCLFLLFACAAFLYMHGDSLLKADRVGFSPSDENLITGVPLTNEAKISQPFIADGDKLSVIEVGFWNPAGKNTKGMVTITLEDANHEAVAETEMALEYVRLNEPTKFLFDGSSELLNKNFIVDSSRKSSPTDYIDLEEGAQYYLTVTASGMEKGADVKVRIVRPARESSGNVAKNVLVDGKEVPGWAAWGYTNYRLLSFFFFILAWAAILVLLPLEKMEEKWGIDFNKWCSRALFLFTPLAAYVIMYKISGIGLKDVVIGLFSITGLLNLMIIGFFWWLTYVLINRTKYATIVSILLASLFAFIIMR